MDTREKPNGNLSSVNGYSMKTVNGNDYNKNISLPQDTLPFENQVAGHSNSNGKSVLGNWDYTFDYCKLV